MYLDAINYLPYPDRDASKSSERSTISMRDLMPDKTSLDPERRRSHNCVRTLLTKE